jgi:hypothetical protein
MPYSLSLDMKMVGSKRQQQKSVTKITIADLATSLAGWDIVTSCQQTNFVFTRNLDTELTLSFDKDFDSVLTKAVKSLVQEKDN